MKDILLGTLSIEQFGGTLFWALFTAFTMFVVKTTKRDPTSPRTPFEFKWSFLFSDNTREILGTFLLIILSIRFSQKWIDPAYNDYIGFGIGLLSKLLASIFFKLQAKLAIWVNNALSK